MIESGALPDGACQLVVGGIGSMLDELTAQVVEQFEVIAMPTTVVVDRDGNMRYLHQGYKSGDEAKYQKMVKTLVRE
jgi:tartrate dehydratase beta subunit/fumarate hydratase class I family protein